jgi:probable selenium-dependent hydroxylase accessory protein YqeC
LFSEQFAFTMPARVSFVGGGGKTGLILRLMEEYSQHIAPVFTTTTRIHPPHPANGLAVISCDNEQTLQLLLEAALSGWCPGRRLVVTRLPLARDLLRGVDPSFGDRLDRGLFPLVLNEADGARSMSLKMPREHEPVLLAGTDTLVPTIGLDCLERPLGPDTLFRWELAAKRYHLHAGTTVTPDLAASILLHPEGVCKVWQPGMKIIPYINKADEASLDSKAHQLAAAILRNGNFPVERVVMGSVHESRAASVA